MKLNIDTRIFNFINMYRGRQNLAYLYFSKDFMCVSNGVSILKIPCENEIEEPFGLHFNTLKERLANQGSKISLELEFKEDLYDKTSLMHCYFGNFGFECKKNISNITNVMFNYKEPNFINKVDVSCEIFKNTFTKFSALRIRDHKVECFDLANFEKNIKEEILTLSSIEKFNGLDKNKDFTLFYIEAGEKYKAVQDDVILIEIGLLLKEKK